MRQIFEYHPVIGYRFVPGLKARIEHEGGGYLLRTNESGFRCDHPFQKDRRDGRRRILLFGDSYTAGEGVSNGQRFGDGLEKRIPELEVYNFGLPGTGTDQHYLAYQEYGRGIEHDLLIIAVFVENIRRVVARYRYYLNEAGQPVLYAKPYYTLEGDRLVLNGVPPAKQPFEKSELPPEERGRIFTDSRFPRLKRAFRKLRRSPLFERVIVASGLKENLQRVARYQCIPEYDHPDDPGWLTMRAILGEWISGHSQPVLVVPIPLYHHVAGISDARGYQTRLREAASEFGAAYHDPLPDLQSASPPERRAFYYHKDSHLTRSGHDAVAESMRNSVERLLGAGG